MRKINISNESRRDAEVAFGKATSPSAQRQYIKPSLAASVILSAD